MRVVLASSFKIAFQTAFGRYLSDLRPRASLIYSRILEEIEDARICLSVALVIDLGPILVPFCTPKPVQNWSKIGSEMYQTSVSFLNALQDLPKIDFGTYMAPS